MKLAYGYVSYEYSVLVRSSTVGYMGGLIQVRNTFYIQTMILRNTSVFISLSPSSAVKCQPIITFRREFITRQGEQAMPDFQFKVANPFSAHYS